MAALTTTHTMCIITGFYQQVLLLKLFHNGFTRRKELPMNF